MHEKLTELPESKEEVKISILIKGDYCSKDCPFLCINYDECDLFEAHILNHYKGPNCYCLFVRCASCKEKVPSK